MGAAAFAFAGIALLTNILGKIMALILTRPVFVLRKAVKYGFALGFGAFLLMLVAVGIDNSDGCKSTEKIMAKGRAYTANNPDQYCDRNSDFCRNTVRLITAALLTGTQIAKPVCWATGPYKSKTD